MKNLLFTKWQSSKPNFIGEKFIHLVLLYKAIKKLIITKV